MDLRLLTRNLRRLLRRAILMLIAAQGILLTILWWASYRRQQRRPASGFAHIKERLHTEVDSTDITIYTAGEDLFDDMLATIASAQETIFFETFIWKNDRLGTAFADALLERARAGVRVYVIYDAIGNLMLERTLKSFPDVPTFHVLPFQPFHRPWHLLLPRHYTLDHRKLLIVDQKVGFIGGYNVGEMYRTEWRDTHLQFDGRASRDLAYAFADFWRAHGSEDIEIEMPIRPWSPIVRVHRNDPVTFSYPIRAMYLEAVEHAQSHIYITNAYFVPDRTIRRGLLRAAQRGVDVRILLPWRSNHFLVDWLARHRFEEYLRGGVRIFGFEGAMIHAKTATIDGVWTMVGTANLDRLSMSGNYEINVEIFDNAVALQMEAVFECDLTNAFELTLERWLQRPYYRRIAELAVSPFWPLL